MHHARVVVRLATRTDLRLLAPIMGDETPPAPGVLGTGVLMSATVVAHAHELAGALGGKLRGTPVVHSLCFALRAA